MNMVKLMGLLVFLQLFVEKLPKTFALLNKTAYVHVAESWIPLFHIIYTSLCQSSNEQALGGKKTVEFRFAM
jgi:hypothetical protein